MRPEIRRQKESCFYFDINKAFNNIPGANLMQSVMYV